MFSTDLIVLWQYSIIIVHSIHVQSSAAHFFENSADLHHVLNTCHFYFFNNAVKQWLILIIFFGM